MTTIIAPLTFSEVQKLLPGVNARALREEIQRIGCYSKIGGKMYLEVSDFRKLLEETKEWRSRSYGAKASPTSMELLPDDAYERALELATGKSQNTLKAKQKHVSSKRRSTERNTKSPSPRLVSCTKSQAAKASS